MNNLLYQGSVVHHRLKPKNHRFQYNVNYFFFDLSKPSDLITIPWILTFRPKNYLTEMQAREELTKHFGMAAAEVKSIFILTQLSYFGFCFNPVSFYYCYGKNNKLLFILSLTTNTPWGEKHVNCFDFEKFQGEFHFAKEFHVSPFMPMEIDYTWNFNNPHEHILITMQNKNAGETNSFFSAQMNLKSQKLTHKNVYLSLINFPLMSFRTIVGIYWQALVLYLKKVPFYAHPHKKEAI